MSTLSQTLRREVRVTFSLKAQPLWVRLLKWSVSLVLLVCYHDQAWFWPAAAILFALSLAVHFFYRWKTGGWTSPWGGWNDLEAGRGENRQSYHVS